MEKATEYLSVKVSPETNEKLRAEIAAMGYTLSDFVREAIAEHLKRLMARQYRMFFKAGERVLGDKIPNQKDRLDFVQSVVDAMTPAERHALCTQYPDGKIEQVLSMKWMWSRQKDPAKV